jgi:hypothetical protein
MQALISCIKIYIDYLLKKIDVSQKRLPHMNREITSLDYYLIKFNIII